ncbi:hypothetical protein [Halobacterium jilantaiense]|uniref:Uncharacterized protein n=1 Tax=Halobacterium jilantaiense TaxID=355548 RepID=A0A1I0QGB7_9EURY|nr:hypothetical protein [Halobacterium jilantaiense]SEW25887.1 hypothetical protein SAMN04487945_2566 [Halobacterium jilantaiense]
MPQDYRLVSELVRPGDSLPCPEDADPVVRPAGRPGFVCVTYLKEVTRVPFTGGGDEEPDLGYVR